MPTLTLTPRTPGSLYLTAPYPLSAMSIFNVKDYGATGDGATDDSTAIVAANAAATAAGGIVYFPAGTYKLTSTLTGASSVTFAGVGDASVVKWGGAVSTPMVQTAPAAASNVTGFNIHSLVLDANSTSGVTPLLMQSWQYSVLADVVLQNVTGSSTPALRMEAAAGTDFRNNTVGNDIRNLYINGAPVGIQFSGQEGGSTTTYVVNNRFHGLYMNTISVQGIRFKQWCDSNSFHGVQIALTTNNAVGIVFNDSSTPAADVGVYNNNFFHLSIDSFGITGATGLLMNVCKQLLIQGFYHSPVAFNGTLVNDNSSRAISYDLLMTQDNASTNKLIRYSKLYAHDTGGGSGLASNYTNYLVQTMAATTGAPQLKAIGSDTDVNLLLSGQGAGGVAMTSKLFPPTDAGAAQTGGGLYMGSGAPANANGSNGSVYFRTDTPAVANQRIYIRSAGAWVGIV